MSKGSWQCQGAWHSHICACFLLLLQCWAMDSEQTEPGCPLRQGRSPLTSGSTGWKCLRICVWQKNLLSSGGSVGSRPWQSVHGSGKGEARWGLRAHSNLQLCNSECFQVLESFISHKWPMLNKCLLANFLFKRKGWGNLHKGKIFPMLLVLIFLHFFT